jgi:hypothetical protein
VLCVLAALDAECCRPEQESKAVDDSDGKVLESLERAVLVLKKPC